ncbi:MAG: alpha/beta hydrolase, partial [Halioglobus sp.]|nr:alpha/beta hydrolase [Halioglobus sp.]
MRHHTESASAPTWNAELLAQIRQQRPAGRSQLLDESAVQEQLIPGPPGAPDVRVFVIAAEKGASHPAILFIHGGGFILGDASADLAVLQALALKHDCVIVSVDYRLAPETAFPGPVEDAYAALKWMAASSEELGVDPSRIAVMGESAGGGLAAMLALMARDRAEVPITQQILIYPMLDDRTGSTISRPYWMGAY